MVILLADHNYIVTLMYYYVVTFTCSYIAKTKTSFETGEHLQSAYHVLQVFLTIGSLVGDTGIVSSFENCEDDEKFRYLVSIFYSCEYYIHIANFIALQGFQQTLIRSISY